MPEKTAVPMKLALPAPEPVARSSGKKQWHDAEDEGEGGHENGVQAQPGCLGGHLYLVAALAVFHAREPTEALAGGAPGSQLPALN